jgi:two-component system, NarL family, nitrate/nitrite response regulator NarL
MSDSVRILLVDDHVLFRKGLAGLLASQSHFSVIGEAGDGEEAVALTRTTRPDLVLMDIHMPRCTGLQAIPLIKAEKPDTKIVMLTVSAEDHDLFLAIQEGAEGYLTKDLEPKQLFDLLTGIERGESAIAPAMATRILHEFRNMQNGATPPPENPDELTPREIEVLEIVARGATNKEIAAALSITENTVKIHLRNILEKLHLQNRTQATAYAIQRGLTSTTR